MNVLVFNIETVPDIEGGQKIYGLHGLDDNSTGKALFHLRKQQTGSDELALHLQKIVAISIVYRGMSDNMGQEVSVKSLGTENSSEAELLADFFQEIESRTPTLVSWNGTGFDMPVIHYRSLKNQISAPGYWDKGHHNEDFADDNYLSRYHDRHTDLMDVLASYNQGGAAPLNDIALMLDFPGIKALTTSETWDAYQVGQLADIRSNSEISALNTYLIFLRFQLLRGTKNPEMLNEEFALLRETLENADREDLHTFSQNWKTPQA